MEPLESRVSVRRSYLIRLSLVRYDIFLLFSSALRTAPLAVVLTTILLFLILWWRSKRVHRRFLSFADNRSQKRGAFQLEAPYRLIENLREGIQVLGFDWHYLFVNDAVVRQSHYSRDQLIGHTIIERYPGVTETAMFKVLQRCMKEREAAIFENEFVYPDGTVGWFELSIQPIPEGLLILSIDATQRKEAERKVGEHQQILARATLQAQENERHQLGLELHDNITQILATVKMYIEVLRGDPEDWHELVERSSHYLNLAITETRQLSHTLIAPSLGELSLSDVLGNLAQTAKASLGPAVEFIDHTPPDLRLDRDKALMLYRIAQEQLQNICKHARASKAWMVLSASAREIALSISDNGVGFVPTARSEGIGLKNIRSRVQWLAGKMSLDTAPSKGCTLEVTLPLY